MSPICMKMASLEAVASAENLIKDYSLKKHCFSGNPIDLGQQTLLDE